MQYCPNCGKPVSDTDAFCESCGAGLARPEAEPSAPATATSQPPPPPPAPASSAGPADAPAASGETRTVAPWLVTDWPLAALCVVVFLAIAAGVGGLLGLVASLIANGLGTEGLIGLLSGAWAMFAGLGADVVVATFVNDGGVFWFSSGVMLAATLGLVALASLIYRSALRYVGESKDFTLAFVGKVTLIGTIAVAILSTVMSIGDLEDDDSVEGFTVLSDVGSAEPAWGAFLLLGLVGLVSSRQRVGVTNRLDRFGWARPLRDGIAAWAVMVLVLGTAASFAGMIASDDATEGLAGAAVTPVLVGNSGVSAHAFAVGASNDTVGEPDDVSPLDDTRLDAHVSLFHFDIPPQSDSNAAPIWFWPLLAVAPLLVFFATRRLFEKHEVLDAQSILLTAATVAGGFALASWLGALLAPLHAGGFAQSSDEPFDFISRAVVARPSVGATLGLSLFWGAIGAFAAGAVWARKHQIELITSSSSAGRTSATVQTAAPTTDAPQPPPPPAAPTTTDDPAAGTGACPHCGAPHSGGRFCSDCGHEVAPPSG